VTPDLSVEVAGLRLKNPVIAGSGEATMSREAITAALDSGAAAVVAKSTNESQAAKRQLRSAEYVLLDDRWCAVDAPEDGRGVSLLNRSGLVNEPFDRWLEVLAETDSLASERGAYVVASLIVAEPAEAVRMARAIEASGIRWLELNLGAPHAEEAEPGAITAAHGAERVGELVRMIRTAVSIPLTVKLAYEGAPLACAEAAFAAGADAVCLTGRFLAFLPDPETRRPVLGTFAAIGGGWALPLTLRWVARARQRLGPERSLIGTNGARNGLDVARFLLAGARAVQMTTSVIIDGPTALTRAIEELSAYLQRQGATAAEIVGEATDAVMSYAEVGRTEGERAG
jgi:dihydroorotate dehydrogenase (NAD+) catalytic subunit